MPLSTRGVFTCLVAVLNAACSGPGPPTAQWFTDITADAGLDFVHEAGADAQLHMPAVMGGGVALFDFDQDGDLDVYLTNGSHDLTRPGADAAPENRLYRRDADGRYVDATAASGLGDTGFGMGVAVGDVDNDGDLDVYVANYGPDRLYRNEGDGTFTDVTAAAGIAVDGWSSSAAFLDVDRDGFLDLYVVRYVDYRPEKRCFGKDGRRDFCGPNAFQPLHDVLLRNQGDTTFADVSEAAGIASIAAAGLGVVCLDIDGDGWQDAYIANDADPNQLWINLGSDATGAVEFRDDSLLLGVAYNLHGQAQAGMGVLAEDLDGNGALDFFLTHLMSEANTLYGNFGDAAGFKDVSGGSGLGPSSMPYTGFGVVALDVELDGDLDLFVANGKVNVAEPVAGSRYPAPWNSLPERNLFYLNDGRGRFEELGDPVRALGLPGMISRGIASGDIDDDGDVDLLVANLMDRPRLLRNDAPRRGHWLAVRVLDPRLQRDALGARVTVVTGDRRQVRSVATSTGYLASQSPWLHFGVGESRTVDRIEVHWPDGGVETFAGRAVDRAITLRRGEGDG